MPRVARGTRIVEKTTGRVVGHAKTHADAVKSVRAANAAKHGRRRDGRRSEGGGEMPALSDVQRRALEQVRDGERVTVPTRTQASLWRRGLVATARSKANGLQLTAHGRHALRTGRLMFSGRTHE